MQQTKKMGWLARRRAKKLQQIKQLEREMQAYRAMDIKRNVGPEYKGYRAKYDQAMKLRQQMGLVKKKSIFAKAKSLFARKKVQQVAQQAYKPSMKMNLMEKQQAKKMGWLARIRASRQAAAQRYRPTMRMNLMGNQPKRGIFGRIRTAVMGRSYAKQAREMDQKLQQTTKQAMEQRSKTAEAYLRKAAEEKKRMDRVIAREKERIDKLLKKKKIY